jgi:hypothetical protein
MLYISVLVPVQVSGMFALPSSPSQVAPPSQERSSHAVVDAGPGHVVRVGDVQLEATAAQVLVRHREALLPGL